MVTLGQMCNAMTVVALQYLAGWKYDRLYYPSDSFRTDWQVVVMNLDGSNKIAVRNGIGPSDDPGLARPAVY